MPTYRAVIEYDGTDFSGLQFQGHARTVAGEVERVLAVLFGEPVKITAAGRTDAGVHASGQVVSFRTVRAFPYGRLGLALNGNLPADVSVREVDEVSDGFSARYDALGRAYEYRIVNRPLRSALERRFAHHVHQPIDIDRVRTAAADVLGEHDFVAFCGVLPERGGTVRRVDAIEVRRDGDIVTLRLEGSGFLHRMVRIVAGTLIEIGTARRDPVDVPAIIASRDRRRAGYTAPPEGLRLVGVRYAAFDSERR